MSINALSKGTSRAHQSGAPSGNLVATISALKMIKDAHVAIRDSDDARLLNHVFVVRALRVRDDVDVVLTKKSYTHTPNRAHT